MYWKGESLSNVKHSVCDSGKRLLILELDSQSNYNPPFCAHVATCWLAGIVYGSVQSIFLGLWWDIPHRQLEENSDNKCIEFVWICRLYLFNSQNMLTWGADTQGPQHRGSVPLGLPRPTAACPSGGWGGCSKSGAPGVVGCTLERAALQQKGAGRGEGGGKFPDW